MSKDRFELKTMSSDTQVVDWIEENLLSLNGLYTSEECLEMKYIGINGEMDKVVRGDSLRECVEKAAKEQDGCK